MCCESVKNEKPVKYPLLLSDYGAIMENNQFWSFCRVCYIRGKFSNLNIDPVTQKTRRSKVKSRYFAKHELQVLVDNVERYQDTLKSKLSNNVTNDDKNKIWDKITARVNAVSEIRMNCRLLTVM